MTSDTKVDLRHEGRTDKETQLKMANAKKTWLIEYQAEREGKREYIRKNVTAAGLDETKLLQKMQDQKGKCNSLRGLIDCIIDALIPSLDDYTMTELMNLVDELAHEDKKLQEEKEEKKQMEGEIDTSGKKQEDDVKSHMALFDNLQAKEDQELDDSVSSVRSSNSFRSVSTRKVKHKTVLN